MVFRSGLALVAAAALIGATFTTPSNATPSNATPSNAASAPVTAEIAEQAQTIAGFGASGAWWVNDLAHYSPAAQPQVARALPLVVARWQARRLQLRPRRHV